MSVCIDVNGERFEVEPETTVGEIVKLGGGKLQNYELERRDGPQGAIMETYDQMDEVLDLARDLPSPGAGPGGPGGHVTDDGGASPGAGPGAGPGAQVAQTGGSSPGEDGSKTHTTAGVGCVYFTTRFTGPINNASCVSGEPTFFEQFLGRKKIRYQRADLDGCRVYIFEHVVPRGGHAGKTVTVGLPIPADFPVTAPYGFHIRADHGLGDAISNTNQSGLGPDWQFWSRSVHDWVSDNQSSQYYFDHVDKWLELS